MAMLGTGVARRPVSTSSQESGRELQGLAIQTRFCPEDVDPFETVAWELRVGRDQGRERRSAVRADQLRDTGLLEPTGDQRGREQVFLRRGEHARARTQRAAVDSPRHAHDRRLGDRRRLLRLARGRRALLSRSDLALPAPVRRVQFAGVVQRRPVSPVRRQRLRSATGTGTRRPTRSSSPRTPTNTRKARPASSRACATTWKTSWSSRAARPCCSSSAPAPAPICRRCVRIAKSSRAADAPRARCRSCACTTRSRPW